MTGTAKIEASGTEHVSRYAQLVWRTVSVRLYNSGDDGTTYVDRCTFGAPAALCNVAMALHIEIFSRRKEFGVRA